MVSPMKEKPQESTTAPKTGLSKAVTPPTSEQRRPQTRLSNAGASFPDLGLPASVRRRRLTPGGVAAVCEQLGDDVSTRNVQRVLGGSLRDIGPLVQLWRDNRVEIDSGQAGAGESVKAIGAILMSAIQGQSERLIEANEQALDAFLARIQVTLDTQSKRPSTERADRHAGAGLTSSAWDGMQREMRALQEAMKGLQASAPESARALSSDLTARLEKLMRAVTTQDTGATVRDDQLVTIGGQLEAVTLAMAQLPDLSTQTQIAKNVIEKPIADLHRRLNQLQEDLQAIVLAKPAPRRPAPSRAVLTRLDAISTAMATLQDQVGEIKAESIAKQAAAKKKAAATRRRLKAAAAKRAAPPKAKTTPTNKTTSKKIVAKKAAVKVTARRSIPRTAAVAKPRSRGSKSGKPVVADKSRRSKATGRAPTLKLKPARRPATLASTKRKTPTPAPTVASRLSGTAKRAPRKLVARASVAAGLKKQGQKKREISTRKASSPRSVVAPRRLSPKTRTLTKASKAIPLAPRVRKSAKGAKR